MNTVSTLSPNSTPCAGQAPSEFDQWLASTGQDPWRALCGCCAWPQASAEPALAASKATGRRRFGRVAGGLFTGLALGGLGVAAGLAAAPAHAAGPEAGKPDAECKRSVAANLVPAATVEQGAVQQYAQMMQMAQQKGALAPTNDEQLQRLRYIAKRIIPFALSCNARASQWQWDVELLRSNQLNAFCMPGGKIAFFTGILARLKLNDDEVAMIMGHEVAHALLEHARERMAKSAGTSVGLRVLAAALGLGSLGDLAAQGTANVLSLKFSRSDESEADALGLVLAAKAGYDPRAGISLWQKMGGAKQGSSQPPPWLSTHPAGPERIKAIEKRLKRVVPMFDAAGKPDRTFAVAA